MDCPQFCLSCRQSSTGDLSCLTCINSKYITYVINASTDKCKFNASNSSNCVPHCNTCTNEFECDTCDGGYAVDSDFK